MSISDIFGIFKFLKTLFFHWRPITIVGDPVVKRTSIQSDISFRIEFTINNRSGITYVIDSVKLLVNQTEREIENIASLNSPLPIGESKHFVKSGRFRKDATNIYQCHLQFVKAGRSLVKTSWLFKDI